MSRTNIWFRLCLVNIFVALAARGESPAAFGAPNAAAALGTPFGRRCIPADCVAPPSNIPDILGRHALSAGRLAALGATPDFHHGLLGIGPGVPALAQEAHLHTPKVSGMPEGVPFFCAQPTVT